MGTDCRLDPIRTCGYSSGGMSGKTETYVIVVVLLAALACQCILSMLQKSATSDEVPHLTAGYAYLTRGDYRLNVEHPPLIKLMAAVPLVALDLDFNAAHPSWGAAEEWSFGEEFINNNRVSPHDIVFAGRLPIVLLSVMLGLLVFRWSREIYGNRAGFVALILYAFSPNILANSRLVTLDLGIALFMLLAVYTFYHLLIRPSIRTAVLAGIAFGLALSTKFTAFSLVPVYIILATLFFAERTDKGSGVSQILKLGILSIAVALGILVLTYRVNSFGAYFEGLRFFMDDVKAGGRPSFLFGHHSTEGWAYYFLAAMLIKTPIPALILICLAIAVLAKRRQLAYAEYCLLVPVVVFLAVSSLSRLQLGLRYVLYVYPFLFILAGGVTRAAALRKVAAQIALAAVLAWYVVSALITFPHYIPYFNEFVGGSGNGYKYLIDSNVDWGQDLPGLRDYLEHEGNPEIILSFFGTAAPRAYGIEYQDFYSFNRSARTERHVNSLTPAREFFVISANALQCLYFPDKSTFDWLKRKEPAGVIGHSLFAYDITDDAESHYRLGVMYLSGNVQAKAERQFRRVLVLSPDNRPAKDCLEVLARRRHVPQESDSANR